MKDSITYDFADDMDAGREFVCRCLQSTINGLLLTDFLEFVRNPGGEGQTLGGGRSGT